MKLSFKISIKLNGEHISLSKWHRQPDSKATAAPGENPWLTTTTTNKYQQHQKQNEEEDQHQYQELLDNFGPSEFQPISNLNYTWNSPTLNRQPYKSQQSISTPRTISGAFGQVGYKPTLKVDNMSPSPPPLPWSSCSMFMVDPGAWTDGISSKNDSTGEQLNTPRPEDVCGFENGSFEGLVSYGNNPASVISKNRSSNEDDRNGSNNTSSSMYGCKKGQQQFKYKTNPMTPPSFTLDEASFIAAPFDSSWQFEPCPEETMLSPEISYLTPHQSPGVASPGSSSGAAEYRETDDFETCVDFSNIIFVPNTEALAGSTALTDEIEQLSESYYCKSNNLISIDNNNVGGDDSVSPIFLKVLQEEATAVGDEIPASVATNGIVFGTNPPSIASILQTDADNDDIDDNEDEDELEKPGKDGADAIAWTQEALQNVSSRDDTLDLKTQTQLEHNYTIKLPLDEGTLEGPNLTAANTVEEPLIPRETTPVQQTKRVQPSVKRQLFEKKHAAMETGPKLKLNLPAAITAAAPVLNTPDLTNQVLELEADIFKNEVLFDLVEFIDSDYNAAPTSPIEEKPKLPAPAEPAPRSTICEATLSDLFNPGKRKLPMITIENINELTASSNPKRSRYAASSTTSSVCGDNASETSSTPRAQKRRGRPPKQDSSVGDWSKYQNLSPDDQRYREQRDKNNEASRRSRLNRRDREVRLEQEAEELMAQYEELKEDEQNLIQNCARWRKAVMRLALL